MSKWLEIMELAVEVKQHREKLINSNPTKPDFVKLYELSSATTNIFRKQIDDWETAERSLAEYKLALELCAQEVPPVLFIPKPSPYIFNDPDHWLTRAREEMGEHG